VTEEKAVACSTGSMKSQISFTDRSFTVAVKITKYLYLLVLDCLREMERIKTYIQRLDELLEGGVPKGTVSMICGTPGCMKSSVAYNILYHNAVKDNLRGLFITLEQEIGGLKEQMRRLGMGGETANLVIVDHTMIDKEVGIEMRFDVNAIKKAKTFLDEQVTQQKFDLVVLDPLNALYTLSTIKNPRRELYRFFTDLRSMGLTSFVISEMYPEEKRFGKYGVEDFLSDAIIHLDFRRERDMLERYIGVVKMRYTHHSLQYFPLVHEGENFAIYTKEEMEL
jgi:KaiC/GvpD/RAD55 family RecA-like ATPase